MTDKILQIISANGWAAERINEVKNSTWLESIVCFALVETEKGDRLVVPMVAAVDDLCLVRLEEHKSPQVITSIINLDDRKRDENDI